MKNTTYKMIVFVALTFVLLCTHIAWCDNIDPDNDGSKYAYGENVGWLNFGTRDGDVTVSDPNLTGYIWGENIGWINLYPNYGGVINDGTGLLSGYAWAENAGWINFNPIVPDDTTHYGVTIDSEGNFSGWAWGENIGWIHLQAVSPVAFKVKTSWITSCRIDMNDLAVLTTEWLLTGTNLIMDLDEDEDVDLYDVSRLSNIWLTLCEPGWPIKDN
jgi:hypothetical protein